MTFTTLHTFDQEGLYNTLYGIGYGKGPVECTESRAGGSLWREPLGRLRS